MIPPITRDGFGELFDTNGLNCSFTAGIKKKIKNNTMEKVLCDLYSYYNSQRHSVFHMDGTVVTSRILDRPTATHIIETTLNLIDRSYSLIK